MDGSAAHHVDRDGGLAIGHPEVTGDGSRDGRLR